MEQTETDRFTISTYSYYAQSTDTMPVLASEDQHVPISEAYAPRPPSPSRPYPADVPPYTQTDPGSLPSPVYHRPFSPPSIYPIVMPHPRIEDGILVTIHRQASVDHIV